MPWLASNSVSWPRLDTHGVCPTSRRQWADFLVSLMAPLHRQYKTARTETRRHLLLKIRQMPTQTSASRGYVLFRGANKGHTRKSYKLSPGCGHDPRSAPNLERHGSSQMQTSGWLEMPHFLNRISTCISIWNPTVRSSHNITYHPKEVYASCDNFCPVNMGLHNMCPKNWTHDAIHSFYQMTKGVYFLWKDML